MIKNCVFFFAGKNLLTMLKIFVISNLLNLTDLRRRFYRIVWDLVDMYEFIIVYRNFDEPVA